MPAKLSFLEKFGYGLGDAACNFVWGTMTSFLLFFYTDIFGIPAAAIGTLFLFARVSDGFVDLVVGAAADRTRTRWGKFRPYLVWFCIPIAAVFVATFTTPAFSVEGKIIYAWITYNLLMIMYTAINVPYGALSGVMTDEPLDRTSLNSFRMGCAQIGALAVNALTLPLISAFGHGDDAKGYQLTVGLFSLIAIAFFLTTFFTTKERIQPPPGQKTNLGRDLKSLFANKPWVFMFIAGCGSIFNTISGAAKIYYAKYYLGIEAKPIGILGLFSMDQISFFLVMGSVGFIVGAVTVRQWVKLFGKKNLFIGCLLAMAGGCVAFYYIPPANLNAVFISQLVLGYIGGISAPLYFAMIGDTADYAEWKFHVRMTGIIFSANSCSQKIGLGIGGAASGYLLKEYGYVAHVAQSASANYGILLMVSLIPAAGYALIGVVFFFYPLNEAFCHTIREDLAQRRQRLSENPA
ncbi:MAG: MFS transporter [Methylacidiphilales bacterium]|nr:MFS transporter [Candidatus Methylacidiphilales bacterium]